MKVLVSGSLAYDRIMDFPGRFSDHIMPDKIHMINVRLPLPQGERKPGVNPSLVGFKLCLRSLAREIPPTPLYERGL